MKNWGGHFTPELGGHFELESGAHFKLELGGQYHRNMQLASKNKKYTYLSVNIRIQIRNILSKCKKLLPK